MIYEWCGERTQVELIHRCKSETGEKTKNVDTKRIRSRRHFWLWKERTNGKSKNNHKILDAFLMQNVFVTRFTMMNIVKRPNFVVGCCKVLKWKTVRLLNRLNRFANAKNSFASSHRPQTLERRKRRKNQKWKTLCFHLQNTRELTQNVFRWLCYPPSSFQLSHKSDASKCRERTKRRWSANGPPGIINAIWFVWTYLAYALNERSVATRN